MEEAGRSVPKKDLLVCHDVPPARNYVERDFSGPFVAKTSHPLLIIGNTVGKLFAVQCADYLDDCS